MGEYIVIHNGMPRHKKNLSSYQRTQYIFNWDISQQQGQLFKTPVSQWSIFLHSYINHSDLIPCNQVKTLLYFFFPLWKRLKLSCFVGCQRATKKCTILFFHHQNMTMAIITNWQYLRQKAVLSPLYSHLYLVTLLKNANIHQQFKLSFLYLGEQLLQVSLGVVSISEVKDVKQHFIFTFLCFYPYAILLYVKNQVASQGGAVKLLLYLASMVKDFFLQEWYILLSRTYLLNK